MANLQYNIPLALKIKIKIAKQMYGCKVTVQGDGAHKCNPIESDKAT